MRYGRQTAACCLAGIVCFAPSHAAGAELTPAAVKAYEAHVSNVTRDFLGRARKDAATSRRCDGVLQARAGSGDGILTVPGGLLHHWLGFAFVKGATMKQAETVARDYPAYSRVYKNVVSSRVLSQQGDTYRVLIRLKEGEAGINAVLDVRSAVDYRSQPDGSLIATSRSEEIREVENAGRPNESLLPAGRDSGYLWRAHTFTRFIGGEDGVLVVMETLGLSRRFPRGLGWLIEPIARRLGRKSVEGSLDEFAAAIRRSAGLPAPTSACD
jgi:hypothetical protein